MRHFILLFILTTLSACKQASDAKGFWVGIGEDGKWSNQTIEITTDSIFIYDYFGMPLKSSYLISGSEITFGDSYQLFSNEKLYDSGAVVEIEISDDILYWKLPPVTDKYMRSRFNSYVEHFANSKGLKIELPTSDSFSPSNFNNYTYIDLFIGYNDDNEIKFRLNDTLLESDNSLIQSINQESDGFHTKYVLRLFADKSIPSEYIMIVREALKGSNIHLLQTVTKPSGRKSINLFQNPYSNHFYGHTTVVRNQPKIRVVE